MNDNLSEEKSQVRSQFNASAADYDTGPGCFAYFGKQLVQAAEIAPGERVLDVACGRGAVLFPCAEQVSPKGQVVGIDLAEEMVRTMNAEAAQRGISGRAQVMDAEHLDFPDATFDKVLCGFGIMFFPDQLRALGEFRRVLKSGGRLAVSTWKVDQTSEIKAAMAELGIQRPQRPGWISEAGDLSKLLVTAGFASVSVKADAHPFHYANCDEYWEQARGTGMRQMLDGLRAANAERLRGILTMRVKPDKQGQFCSTSTALLTVASR